MQDPIKIIHKFKNNNRRIQYKVYIFIGSLIPKDIDDILELIINKDFYMTLIMLNTQQYNSLVNYYGEFWYDKFFISYHINSQKQIINSNITKKNALITKYNETWYNKHIVNLSIAKLSYSFASMYYNYFTIKKKIKSHTVKTGIDYRTYNIDNTKIKQQTQSGGKSLIKSKVLIKNKSNRSKIHGDIEESNCSVDETTETEETTETDETEDEISDDKKTEAVDEEELDEQIEETFNLNDITQLYTTPTETSKDIMEIGRAHV